MKFKALTGFLALSLSLALAGANASAEKKKGLVDEFSGQGYGLAGCGLGSIFFGPKPGKVQIFASTTNGIYWNNTFGISSGTSNCDIPKMGQQAAVFIEVNKEIVRKDAVRGEGESLDALSMILHCDKAEIRHELKGHFDHYLGQDVDSYETVRRLMNSGFCSTQG
jgi:hypothetical protein